MVLIVSDYPESSHHAAMWSLMCEEEVSSRACSCLAHGSLATKQRVHESGRYHPVLDRLNDLAWFSPFDRMDGSRVLAYCA
jgi:hypothetical protein